MKRLEPCDTHSCQILFFSYIRSQHIPFYTHFIKKNFLLATFAMLPVFIHAQLFNYTPVTNQDDIDNAVNGVLLGEGVAVSNITLYGNLEQMITAEGISNVGVSNGIVLSSGGAADLSLGYNTESLSGLCCDDDLLTVANSVPPLIGQSFWVNEVYDWASLEFDFTPLSDNIAFDFIFASNEYPTWVNTSFNDVFAFFISGPGLTGPYTNNAVNIAVIPGSDPALPITISSVNDQLNSNYYVDNGALANLNVTGYTTPITASLSGLIPGETYHIRLAIADGSDSALNSYIILEEGSFSSSVPSTGFEATDFNSDGIINVDDLFILMNDYGCVSSCSADNTGDGMVTVADLMYFIGAFGEIVN